MIANPYLSLYAWLTALLAVVVVLGVAIWYYRRWVFSETPNESESWTLADLRRLRDSGEVTQEEYERMRATLIGQFQAPAEESGGQASAGQSPNSPRGNEH